MESKHTFSIRCVSTSYLFVFECYWQSVAVFFIFSWAWYPIDLAGPLLWPIIFWNCSVESTGLWIVLKVFSSCKCVWTSYLVVFKYILQRLAVFLKTLLDMLLEWSGGSATLTKYILKLFCWMKISLDCFQTLKTVFFKKCFFFAFWWLHYVPLI